MFLNNVQAKKIQQQNLKCSLNSAFIVTDCMAQWSWAPTPTSIVP